MNSGSDEYLQRPCFELKREFYPLGEIPLVDGIELRCEKFGISFAVRFDDPAILPDIEKYSLPPGWKVATPDAQISRIFVLKSCPDSGQGQYEVQSCRTKNGDSLRCQTNNLLYACLLLENYIESYLIDKAEDLLFVHAGTVAWKGTAIVLPGESFAGKSTLVAALLKIGATYLSDEHAIFNRSGQVIPFPHLLSIRDGKSFIGRRRDVGEFGGRIASSPLRVGVLAFLHYESGADWSAIEISDSQAAIELFRFGFPTPNNIQTSLLAAQKVVQNAHNLKGLRGEVDEAASRLLELAETVSLHQSKGVLDAT